MHTCKKYEDTITNVFRTPKTHPGWISHWPRRRSLASLHALNGFRPLRRSILQWYSLTSFDWSQRRWSDIKIPMLKKYLWSYWDGNCVTWNGSVSFSFVAANHCLQYVFIRNHFVVSEIFLWPDFPKLQFTRWTSPSPHVHLLIALNFAGILTNRMMPEPILWMNWKPAKTH